METGSGKTLLDERGRLAKLFLLVSSFSIVLSSCNTTSRFDCEPMLARFVIETDGNGTLVTCR